MGDQDSDRGGDHGGSWSDRPESKSRGISPWEARLYILIVFCFIGLLSYWTFFDREPGSKYLSMVWVPNPVQRGSELRLQGFLERYRQCPRTEISRSLIDSAGARHILSDIIYNGPAGPLGREALGQVLRVPETATLGEADITVTVAWYCNPMQSLLSRPIIQRTNQSVEIIAGPERHSEIEW